MYYYWDMTLECVRSHILTIHFHNFFHESQVKVNLNDVLHQDGGEGVNMLYIYKLKKVASTYIVFSFESSQLILFLFSNNYSTKDKNHKQT